jgi:polysaccharide biosynthesis protein PslH
MLVVDGEVEDSIRYQEDKAVMIVPLISGGGIRVKIIEGLSMGKVIITTSIGAEGIPYTSGKDILIADNKEEFAEHIGRCMTSIEYCSEIGNNAQILARQTFDLEIVSKTMLSFYERIANEKYLPIREV